MDNKFPKISVLMPVYNTKKEYLKESVESILNQTFTDFEFIIIDDGSEDKISDIINSYNDNRIKFYENEQNLGVATTRNKLLDLAQAPFVAFQDSDDISLPERLSKQYQYLIDNPYISGVGSSYEKFPKIKQVSLPKHVNFCDLLKNCSFSQGTCMLRKADFQKYNLSYNSELKTSEDYDLWCRAIRYLKLDNLQEILLRYRIINNSLCHSNTNLQVNIDNEIRQNMLAFLTDDKIFQKKLLNFIRKHYKDVTYSGLEKIFSIKTSMNKSHKIVTLLGIKIKLKCRGKSA